MGGLTNKRMDEGTTRERRGEERKKILKNERNIKEIAC
jgi:hypothetical protein